MTEMMRALVIDRTGAAGELHLAEVPVTTRISDELIVRVIAAGVNPIDVNNRAGGGVSAAIASFPAVLGNDFAGVVEKVPYAAYPLQPGDRVYGMGRVPRLGGSYAEFIAVSSMSVAPMPTSLGFGEGGGRAARGTHGVGRGHRHGSRARRPAHADPRGRRRRRALRGTARGLLRGRGHGDCSAANLEFVQGLGARHVIDYRSERFEEVAGEQDVVVDLVGNGADETGPAHSMCCGRTG